MRLAHLRYVSASIVRILRIMRNFAWKSQTKRENNPTRMDVLAKNLNAKRIIVNAFKQRFLVLQNVSALYAIMSRNLEQLIIFPLSLN